MRLIRACVLLLFLTAPCLAAEGLVVRVLDGDTIDVWSQGKQVRLRYAGIQAPELHSLMPCAERLGQASRTLNAAMVMGQTVRYEPMAKPDKYGRLDAMVYVGTEWVSEVLVREGLARWKPAYKVNKPDRHALQEAEAQAKAKRLGMWGMLVEGDDGGGDD